MIQEGFYVNISSSDKEIPALFKQRQRRIDRFHVTSHHFRSAILVYHFRLRNPRNFSTTIIPTSKMDSKEKEKESQNKSGVDYSFPISEYAKQLDFPVRDRYLQKIAAYSVATVQLWFMKMKNS